MILIYRISIGSCPGEDSRESILLELCVKLGLRQLVTQPTRPKSGNILDLILCSDDTVSVPKVVGSPIDTDHSLIECSLHVNGQRHTNREETSVSYDVKRGDFEAIKLNLSLTNWFTFFVDCLDVDAMYEKLLNYLRYLRQLFVPRCARRGHVELSVTIEKLVQLVRHETDDDRLKKLRKDLARMSNRLRILEEHKTDGWSSCHR